MSDIVTYKGHIPTGTSTSQIVAFWAYKKTFDRIHKLCLDNGITMTLWVDDIVFSSDIPFPKNWVYDIQKIMNNVSLNLKIQKTKAFSKKEFKLVTGTAISPKKEIRVSNKKRHEIIKLLNGRSVEDLNLKELMSLRGKLVSQRQNEVDFMNGVYQRCIRKIKNSY